MLRIGLFLLTNLAILTVGGVVLSLLGVDSMIAQDGESLNLTSLFIICLVFGMLGSFISLFLSKTIAKWTTKTRIIKTPANETERWLVDIVKEMSDKAGIGMPEVGIFPMDQANAFATGWNRDKALVAISSGMLQRYDREEIKAVMGHEIGHVANGDMITLTLIQGVLNTFVMFFARIIGYVVDKAIFKTEKGVGIGYYIVTIVAQIVLGILASMIVMWFSRQREYRADIAGAQLASREGMLNALRRLKKEAGIPDEMPETMNAFGISSGKREGFKALLMSHPPLDVRIKALQEASLVSKNY